MQKKEPNIIDILQIIFLILLIGIGFAKLIPQSKTIFFSPIGILNIGILELITLLILIAIRIKTFFTGQKSNNPSIIILSAGFCAGALLYLQSLPFVTNVLFPEFPAQYASLFAELTWASMIFISIIYSKKTPPLNFKRKIFIISLTYAIAVAILDRLFTHYFIDYSYKILPNIVFLNITIQTIYLLASYSFIESTKISKRVIFSTFNIGLLWLGIIPLFIFPIFGTTLFAVIMPIIQILGLCLIFAGCTDIINKPQYISFRQQFTIYLELFLIISYVIFILMSSVLLGVRFPLISQYAFFIFFMLVIMIQYAISGNFIKQLYSITEVTNEYNPSKKPQSIEIISDNEIGQLAQKINNITELNWNYSQELKNINTQEEILKKITLIIRSSLDLETTLFTICQEITKLFNTDRVTIIEYLGKQKSYIIRQEYKIKPELKGIINTPPTKEIYQYYINEIIYKQKTLAVDNIEICNAPDIFKKYYYDIGVKSVLGAAIKKEDVNWGTVIISNYRDYRHWTDEDKELIERLADTIYIAIRQAELYEFQKQTAKTETILRRIMSEIKLTKSLKEAYKKLLKNLAEIFDVEKVLFLEISEQNIEDINIKYKYNKEDKSFIEQNILFPKACANNFSKLINKLEPNDTSECTPCMKSDYFDKNNINSLLAIPISKTNKSKKILGFLVLCSKEKRTWTTYEVELFKNISESVVSVIWEISSFIQIEELRNTFITTLAHDFQIPLIAERNALEFLLKISDTNNELISEMLDSNQTLITLLKNVLDIYNYESEKKELFFTEVSIDKLLKNTLLPLQNYANTKMINLIIKTPEKLPLLNIDEREIEKVFNTLLSNAIDHAPKKSTVTIKIFKKNSTIITSIHNFGTPIPEDIKNMIFKRYEMALKLERKIGAGTGLFLAKKIIEAHKGNIWFETGEEEGTTFFFSLPEKL